MIKILYRQFIIILFITQFFLVLHATAGMNQYFDNRDGTISDYSTGLMWEQDGQASGWKNWYGAVDRCVALRLAAYNDWRLPSLDELKTLVDEGFSSTLSINTDYFPNTLPSPSYQYWSSTSDAAHHNAFAYAVGFGVPPEYGSGDKMAFSTFARAVRCFTCEPPPTGCTLRVGNISVSTSETSRTERAAMEAYHAILWAPTVYCEGTPILSGSCYTSQCGLKYGDVKSVCTDGTWNQYYFDVYNCLGICAETGGTWDVVCETTVIQLSSFTATPKAGRVIIEWNTESEINNAGFNIYRATSENGEYTKINDSLIPATGSSSQGASYEFTDTEVQNRKTYYYKLEDMDLNGKSTIHGPVSATPRLIFGIGK
jgi:hypothetical protein